MLPVTLSLAPEDAATLHLQHVLNYNTSLPQFI